MMPTGNSNANNFFGQLNTQSVSAANTGNGGNNGFADFQSFQSTPQSSQMPRQLPQTVIQQQQPQWSTGGAGGNEWNGNFTSALPSNVPSFDGQQQRQRQQQMNTNPFMTSSPSSNNGLPAVQSTISNNSNNPFNTPQPAGGSNNISNFDSLI
jgi:hypothetical protein